MQQSCPDVTELELFVEGSSDDPLNIESHISDCSECRELLGEIRSNLELVAPVKGAMSRIAKTHDVAIPESIGGYRVLREIGRGGMGIVYEAEQANPRRRVAVKVLHPALGTDPRVVRMFRRESQVLGRLRHPQIASILEAGRTGDGRLFFAMELVHGDSLAVHARGKHLTLSRRVVLMHSICEAVAYAHQRGVIHRDLKPSNILVDETGTPRILDFGLARILQHDEGEAESVVTQDGHVQGTLPYMSPEQVRGSLLDIDVRSDVYSLGVVMYELLCDALPYPIDRARWHETARIICESPPRRPSLVKRALRGDLETILLKALEKEPVRRYSGASALAEDLARFEARQPIMARPPTVAYQLRRLVERHRLPSALIAGLIVLLIGFSISMGVLNARLSRSYLAAQKAEKTADSEARRAQREADRAQSEARRAQVEADTANRVTDFLVSVFVVSDPEMAGSSDVSARQLLDSGADRVRRELAGEPLVQARMMNTIGRVYGNLGVLEQAIPLLQDALEIRRTLEPDSMNIADSAVSLATANRALGRIDEARKWYEFALATTRRLRPHDQIHPLLILRSLAEMAEQQGDTQSQLTSLRELLDSTRTSPHGRKALPGALNSLAGALSDNGRYDEAIPLMREAIEVQESIETTNVAVTVRLRGNLAWLLVNVGRLDEAQELIDEVIAWRRKTLPPGHPEIATSTATLGLLHMKRNQFATAEPLLRESFDIRRQYLPPDSDQVAETGTLLGECLVELGKSEEAEPLLLHSDAVLRGAAHTSRARLLRSAMILARAYDSLDNRSEADMWRSVAQARAEEPLQTLPERSQAFPDQ